MGPFTSFTTDTVGTLLSIRAGHGRAAPSNLSCDKRGGVLRLNEVWAPRTFVREGKASNLAGSTMVFHQGSTIRRVGVQDVRDLFLRSGCRRKIRAERSPTRFWMWKCSSQPDILSACQWAPATWHKSHRRTPLLACGAATTSRVGPTSENRFIKVS